MKTLITGATGFLGGALTRRLHGMGWDVTALGRNPRSLAALEAQGIKAVRANLEDTQVILNACKGQDIVFHCGALSSPWGKAYDFYRANVRGTENVIHACEENHVKRLVHVSTPSIYFNLAPRLNVREDAELPEKPVNEYARTKLIAESKIDEAFERGLPVVTIRPRAIFGPGDAAILPRLIDRLQKGRLRTIGDGQNIADLTYVENVVDALLLCAESPANTLGKKYNITNGEPVVLWDMIKKVAGALNLPFPQKHIPYKVADTAAVILELIYRILPGQPEPPLTRYSVSVIAHSATLDISAAKRDLGYKPRISIEEGFDEFVKWWKADVIARRCSSVEAISSLNGKSYR
ncbi:MAG: NAD-dependent epimerase/dehydratase family protein [Chloroflexi bacterium]|nr:NAD-dependent epimerase/dehydratase family protein [Chloroflexota bacterium]